MPDMQHTPNTTDTRAGADRTPTAERGSGSSAAADNAGPGPSSDAGRYWRANLRVLAVLLVIWFLVSFGFGILLVEPLNQFRIGEAKLGFWFAQQGSIFVFIILIGVYVIAMNRLDRTFGLRED